jgi:dTDP-4-dehydrorhamnose reductase
MRWLVTGAGGMLGRDLCAVLAASGRHEAVAATRQNLDITDTAAIAPAVAGVDIVVNTAGWTDVDGAETAEESATLVNGLAVEALASACQARRVPLIQLSTDYVFDGRKDGAYVEDDPPNPQSAYGRSKLEGERAVLEAGPNLVVRTSWVFGDGRNFLRSILAAERAGRPLRVVADQRGRPTYAGDLALALAHLAGGEDAGILHVAGDGEPCSWAELAELAVGHPVEHVTTEQWGAPAPRPANSVLALERARERGVPLGDWRASVRSYVEVGA